MTVQSSLPHKSITLLSCVRSMMIVPSLKFERIWDVIETWTRRRLVSAGRLVRIHGLGVQSALEMLIHDRLHRDRVPGQHRDSTLLISPLEIYSQCQSRADCFRRVCKSANRAYHRPSFSRLSSPLHSRHRARYLLVATATQTEVYQLFVALVFAVAKPSP